MSAQTLISEEEVRTTVPLGLERGEIDVLEMKMIERVFHFDDISVQEIITPFPHVSGTMKTEQLFARMTKSRVHISLVVDETDAVIGVVTLEDVVEVIVGNIEDEGDLRGESLERDLVK